MPETEILRKNKEKKGYFYLEDERPVGHCGFEGVNQEKSVKNGLLGTRVKDEAATLRLDRQKKRL